jgi:DNA-binding transcriptional LysR family regulator
MLNDDDLNLLLAVQSTGSLSQAAQRLGKASSTLSHAARMLEERLDALLFDRSAYRISLTPAGQLLVEQGAILQNQSIQLAQRVRQVAKGWEAQLHITTDELIHCEVLMPVIADFDRLNSGVQLRITHEVLGGTWEALLDQRADLVIGATNEPPAVMRLQWMELGQLQWVFAISPRHPLAKAARQSDQPVSAQAISEHRAVVVADSARFANQRSYGLQGLQTTLAMPSLRAKIAAQVAGLGVGWLPRERIGSELASGALIELPTEQAREPNDLYIGWMENKQAKALQWWVQRLREPRLRKALLVSSHFSGKHY